MKKRLLQHIVLYLAAVLFSFAAIFGIYRVITSKFTVPEIQSPLQSLPVGNFKIIQDINYCTPDGQKQNLDLYLPDNGSSNPLIIYVHGGSWLGGDKDNQAAEAPVEDTKCAIRHLRTKSQLYRINKGKIGIIGESAGGYISAFAGTTGNDARYKTAEYESQSDTVQAVVDIAGPSDFSDNQQSQYSGLVYGFIGKHSLSEASPITYVTKDDPPFLLIHGRQDTVVPLQQSLNLRDRLQDSGVPVQVTIVDNAGHELSGSGEMQPSIVDISWQIIQFFSTNLKL
jgi:acetyl esterase/lipase